MQSIFKIGIVLSIVLSITPGNAQIKNQKTESFKILGNCDMCKSAIEEAANIKNVAHVDWNRDSKIAQITFNAKKTNKEEILKRIALAGFDSDLYLAPDMAYAHLPECCKCERQKKEPVMDMTQTKMEMEIPESKMEMKMPSSEKHTEMDIPYMGETNGLISLFDNYFAVKDALVKTNATVAAANASKMLTAIKTLKIESLNTEEQNAVTKVIPSIMDATKGISESKDIAKQREKFKALSINIYAIIGLYRPTETIYYQFCPMQDANWLSKDSTIKNPYYGSQMLSCGSTVETLNKKD